MPIIGQQITSVRKAVRAKLSAYQVVNACSIQIDLELLDQEYSSGNITAAEYLSLSKMMDERLEDVLEGRSPYDC